MNKPPLGLMPKNIWMLQRLKDINSAITRYIESDMDIPVLWIRERSELISSIAKDDNLNEYNIKDI